MRPYQLRILAFIGLTLLIGSGTGCVQRRLMIRSNPAGAKVTVDDYDVGVTPVAINYTYYGTRKVRLEKAGFETLTVLQPVPAPWYQVPPLDLISDNCALQWINDQRTVEYQMIPQVEVPIDHLRSRAEGLRQSTQAGAIQGVAPGTPPVLAPNGQPIAPFAPPGPTSPLERIAPPNF